MFKKFYFALALIILPIFTFAQLTETSDLLTEVKTIVTDILIPLAFTLALLYFFYGVAKYIWSEGAGKAEGKQIMIWGVVALFVMSSVWGLVAFIQTEFGIDKTTSGTIPTIK